MLSGFYSSATGMIAQTIAMDHITENISNANVSGYKKQDVIFHSFDQELLNEALKEGSFAQADLASGIDIIQGVTDFSQGALRHSGDNHDFALEGKGFFKIDTENGQYFTRNGRFMVNDKYELVTKEGFKVLTANGETIAFNAQIPNVEGTFQVSDDGTVFSVDARQTPAKKDEVGKIGVFEFENPNELKRVGFGLWENQNDLTAENGAVSTKVRQGYRELSNAKPVESMVDMIYNQRLYQSNAGALKTLHTTLKDFISQIV